jgi:hypothetical protein
LQIVREVVRLDEVAWLRFEKGLSEKEIAERTGFTRDTIATRLKRIRRVLRQILDETDAEGRPLPTARVIDGSGLPRELREKLTELLDRLRRLGRNGRRNYDDSGPDDD